MSKHFEVLREVGKDLDLFPTQSVTIPSGGSSIDIVRDSKRVSEEMIKLIQRTFLNGWLNAPRRLVFTAVEHGSGCSWVCAHAAEALAALVDGSVCVVEANPQAPSLCRHFGMNANGVHIETSSQQSSVPDFARSIRGSNLWLISSNELTPGGEDPSNFARLKSRFAEVRSAFNYVLVDTPPVNESAESLVLGRMADGVILVVEAHSTRREAARRAKECLEAANVTLLGVVLNKRTYPIPEAVYSRI